jgi:uncharacterized protein YeaO (DUF488 family)
MKSLDLVEAINVKRIFAVKSESDGFRILVDRLWPRGLKRSEAQVDVWLKEIGPTTELRKWFNHDPDKWEEFVSDYSFQLNRNAKVVGELFALINGRKTITLLFAAKDEVYNNAVALKQYMENVMLKDQDKEFLTVD